MDKLSPEKRSDVMRHVKGKNTAPEIDVRRMLHEMGYRFRLHRKDLPGKPDIVLPKYKLCIFVHGCFWHQHPGCRRATIPASNVNFWKEKFKTTLERDSRNISMLSQAGWRIAVVWECEAKDSVRLKGILRSIFSQFSAMG